MKNLVEIKDLNKVYRKKYAVRDLNYNFEEGKIYGMLGPNGSGKTTTIKILTGLLRETSGQVLIDGKRPGPETKAIVSYLPDRNFLYPWMSIQDAVNFYVDFYEDFRVEKAYELLQKMDLKRDMPVKSLSKGMTEKLNLILVLSREAKVYILDEPIAGVDPVSRDQILETIIENYTEGSTMIITTHLVRDIENIFDKVLFIREGQVHLDGDAEELRTEYNAQIDEIYKKVFGQEGEF